MFLLKRTVCVGVLLSVFVVFVKDAVSQGTGSQETVYACETPKKEKGACVSFNSCPELLALLKRDKRTSEAIQYLKQSTCGFEGTKPKLCCPLKTNQPVDSAGTPQQPWPGGSHSPGPIPTPTPQPEVVEHPVDVSRSSKLSLLPLRICGPSAEEKIFGGKEADVMAFPWMALLGYETSSDQIGYYCGGTLINERYVLTAAHCVTNLLSNMKLISVRLGELHIGNTTDCSVIENESICADPVEDYGVEEVIPHQNFSATKITDDIALIRLNATVTFKRHIKPICLPIGPEQQRTLSGKMIVTGWGITEKGFRSQHLLKVALPIVPWRNCSTSYVNSKIQVSSSRQLCAGGQGGMDSCSGDSGGPMQIYGDVLEEATRMVQFGIVSFGPRECATKNLPGVYTRVGFYMDWILDKLRP